MRIATWWTHHVEFGHKCDPNDNMYVFMDVIWMWTDHLWNNDVLSIYVSIGYTNICEPSVTAKKKSYQSYCSEDSMIWACQLPQYVVCQNVNCMDPG